MVRVGVAVVARVPPGQRVAVSLPRDPLRLEAVGPDGAVVDAVTLREPERPGVRIFNVRARRCYALSIHEYSKGGGIGVLGGPPRELVGKLVTVQADYLFSPAPPMIRVPAGRGGLPFATRTALEAIPCGSTPE